MSESEALLKQQIEELLQFVYLAPVAILKLDADGAVQMLNPMAVQLLEDIDLDPGSLTGPAIMDALSPGLASMWVASKGRVGQVCEPVAASVNRAGRGPVHLVLRLVRPDEGCGMFAIEDVTTTVEQQREISRQRQRFGVVLEQIQGYCVAMLNLKGDLLECNPSIVRMFGAAGTGMVGRPFHQLLGLEQQDDGMPPFSEIEDAVRTQGWLRCEVALNLASGDLIWGDMVVTPTMESEGTISGYVVVIRDVTEQHEAQHRLISEALTDHLTGLLNRRGLESRVKSLERNSSPGTKSVACWIMADIDHFKRVNDTYGHDAGDAVLKHFAQWLQSCVRAGDIVARLGGEEFVIVLPSVPLSLALDSAERMRERVEKSVVYSGPNAISLTSSFGIALQGHGTEWADALSAADSALYRAKSSGRNRVETEAISND